MESTSWTLYQPGAGFKAPSSAYGLNHRASTSPWAGLWKMPRVLGQLEFCRPEILLDHITSSSAMKRGVHME
jgi:hypothetical protein